MTIYWLLVEIGDKRFNCVVRCLIKISFIKYITLFNTEAHSYQSAETVIGKHKQMGHLYHTPFGGSGFVPGSYNTKNLINFFCDIVSYEG